MKGRQQGQAYSLVEVMVVLACQGILFGLALPILTRPVNDSHFDQFCSELTGHLVHSRRLAQLTGRSVWFSVKREEGERYRVSCDSRDGSVQIRSIAGSGYPSHISNDLPSIPLTHPVSGKPLKLAFSSSQLNGFVFREKGASSGNMVFSDGDKRAVCVVVSGETGRFRVYTWNIWDETWKLFF